MAEELLIVGARIVACCKDPNQRRCFVATKERTLTIIFWLVVIFLAWFFLLWASVVPAQEIRQETSGAVDSPKQFGMSLDQGSQGLMSPPAEEKAKESEGMPEASKEKGLERAGESEDSERGIIEARIHCRWLDRIFLVEQVTFNSQKEGRRLFLRVAINQFEGGADQANEFLQDYFRSANKHPECEGVSQCQMMISMIHLEGYAHLDIDKSYLTLPDGTKDYLKEEELFRLALPSPDGQNVPLKPRQ